MYNIKNLFLILFLEKSQEPLIGFLDINCCKIYFLIKT